MAKGVAGAHPDEAAQLSEEVSVGLPHRGGGVDTGESGRPRPAGGGTADAEGVGGAREACDDGRTTSGAERGHETDRRDKTWMKPRRRFPLPDIPTCIMEE